VFVWGTASREHAGRLYWLGQTGGRAGHRTGHTTPMPNSTASVNRSSVTHGICGVLLRRLGWPEVTIGVQQTAVCPVAEVARSSPGPLVVQERLQVPLLTGVRSSAPCLDARPDNCIKKWLGNGGWPKLGLTRTVAQIAVA